MGVRILQIWSEQTRTACPILEVKKTDFFHSFEPLRHLCPFTPLPPKRWVAYPPTPKTMGSLPPKRWVAYHQNDG